MGMDGLELVERLRPLYPCVRAIIVSGHADAASQAAAQRLGVFHYFRKPFALDEFTGVVADALREAAMDVNNSSGTRERHVQLIHHQLLALKRDTGAQAAILTDRDGMMIAHVGDMNGFEKPLTGAAASPGNAFNFVYHQGRTHDIYLADIGNGMRLSLVFDRNQPGSRIGFVLQYTRRAAQGLLDLERASEQATG